MKKWIWFSLMFAGSCWIAMSGAYAQAGKPKDLASLTAELAEAKDLYMSVVSGDASKDPRPQKQGVKGSDYKLKSPEETQKLSASLPTTSTAGDQEGPVATGFFGWAADATHRIMDNSHRGERFAKRIARSCNLESVGIPKGRCSASV